MLRVLLAVEDFGEMVYLQILLNKLGFDVGTVKNLKVLNDSLYKLNPDIVVLPARGKRVIASELSRQTKKIIPKAKIILLAPSNIHGQLTKAEIANAEGVLETPVNPPTFLEMLALLGGLNLEAILEKYKKVIPQLPTDADKAVTMVHGDADARDTDVMEVRSRESRYKKFLTLDEPPKAKHFSKQKVVEIVKEIRSETTDVELEKERFSFIEALFKKKA